jgi:hypothetical protein
VIDQTSDGRRLKILAVVDEYTLECLALEVERCMEAVDVVEVLRKIIGVRGAPENIRPDNVGEFIAQRCGAICKAAERRRCTSSPVRVGECVQRNVQ